jgi:tRNA nucleotidyltransferase (CCA-adding enzyme)
MSLDHVAHKEILSFAEQRINLTQESSKKHREQVNGDNGLRVRLENHIASHPDFSLKKMILSGSLAKSTALKSSSDIDVALYVQESGLPEKNDVLADWIANKLREGYPQMAYD